jgi:hypothetical protein
MVAAIALLLTSSLTLTTRVNGQATQEVQAPATGVQGQAAGPNQSGLVVIKSNWKRGVRGPELRPIFDQTRPGRNPNSNDQLQQMQQAARRMSMRVDGYYYSATIRNDGAKPVKAVVWDYTIANPGDPSSLTHHQFFSRIEIRPGKHKDVYRFAVTPPTRTVIANTGNARLIEEVVVNAVQYKDGSVWKLHQ